MDLFCPKSDVRRNSKPDGSWLTKAGPQFSGAISFWTSDGLQKYVNSGLEHWHLDIVGQAVLVIIAVQKREPQYKDTLQVISKADDFEVVEVLNLSEFRKKYLEKTHHTKN